MSNIIIKSISTAQVPTTIAQRASEITYAEVDTDQSTIENYTEYFSWGLFAYIQIVGMCLILMLMVETYHYFLPGSINAPRLTFSFIAYLFTAFAAVTTAHARFMPEQYIPPESGSKAIHQVGLLFIPTALLFQAYGTFVNQSGLPGVFLLGGSIAVLMLSVYWESVGYEVGEFEKGDFKSRPALWAAARRTIGFTGLFLIGIIGFFDTTAARLLVRGQGTSTEVVLGLLSLLVTTYIFGLSFRVFAYDEEIGLNPLFWTRKFGRILAAISQVVILFVVTVLLNLINVYLLANYVLDTLPPDLLWFTVVGIILLIQLWIATSAVFAPYFTVLSGGFVRPFVKSHDLARGNRRTIAWFAIKSLTGGYIITLVLLIPILLLYSVFPGISDYRVSVILLEAILIFNVAALGELFDSLLGNSLDT